jgi:hypothetical protein
MPLRRLSLPRLLLLDHFRPSILFSQHGLSDLQRNPYCDAEVRHRSTLGSIYYIPWSAVDQQQLALGEMLFVLFKTLQRQGHRSSFILPKLPNKVGGEIIVTWGIGRLDFDMGYLYDRGAFRLDF